jgi:tetratricopeptide (TPR) repeat protein
MQPRLWIWLLALMMLAPATAQAGLYNTSEPSDATLDPTYVERFHNHLLILRSLGMDKVEYDNPMRRRYMLQGELAKRGATANLSVEQKINLSDVLIRRRRADEATELMRGFAADPGNLLAQTNLATAYQMSGEIRRALGTLEFVLKAWPEEWEKLSPEQQKSLLRVGWEENIYRHMRTAETYHLRLLNLRQREQYLKTANDEHLDDLFGVRYVGESGEFEPGTIAAKERKQLPYNAVDIVQQLINWMPYDDRLYWQLGELMNAQGNMKAARMIFDELIVNRQYRAKDAVQHRRLLLDVPLEDESATDALTPDQPIPKDAIEAAPIVWRPLVIAFVAGMLVMLFAQWQWRELRRRRRVPE